MLTEDYDATNWRIEHSTTVEQNQNWERSVRPRTQCKRLGWNGSGYSSLWVAPLAGRCAPSSDFAQTTL